VFLLMGFIIVIGILSLKDTNFTVSTTTASQNAFDKTNWDSDMRNLILFSEQFSPLAGVLCAGYFIHNCSLPILRSGKKPENQVRNLFFGYLLTFLSYATVGSLGYVGFLGVGFKNFYLSH